MALPLIATIGASSCLEAVSVGLATGFAATAKKIFDD